MGELFDFINRQTNNKFKDLLFFAGKFDCKNKKLEISFNYLEDDYQKIRENTDELKTLIEKFFKNQLTTEVKIKHLAFDKELCETQIKNFFTTRPEIRFVLNIDNIKIRKNDDYYEIILPINNEFFGGSLKQDFVDFVTKYMAKYGLEPPEILCEDSQTKDVEKVLEDRVNKINEQIILDDEKITLEDVENVFGEVANLHEVILATNKLEVVKNIAVCGEISKIGIREFTRNEKEKKMLSFSLVDGNKKVDCVCFSKEVGTLENVEDLNGKQAVVLADVDNYNEKISLKVKALATCKIIKPQIKFKNVAKDYITIKPENFEEIAQSNFLIGENQITNEQLKNNTYVVFDLETTGLEQNCCIVEIGAVKIEGGKITQTFETLIDPEMPMPEKTTQVNNITDDMLKGKPTIKQVIGDFYKFCYGSVLVGHNSKMFDMPILKRVGLENRYDFSNEQLDTYELARQRIKGLKKYKLGFLCETLNISLEGAHRALNDTVATAKLFIKLMENYS